MAQDGFVQFTKRTNDPKLEWLQRELARKGINSVRDGYSWSAPILMVRQNDLDKAWDVLDPVDDVDDDDLRFLRQGRLFR